MKNLLILLASVITISSCSSSKKAVTANRNDLKGTWMLSSISYEGIASTQYSRIVLLDEGTQACLTGSTWVLPNNGYGSYTIAEGKANCLAGEKNIVWSYRKENDQPYFQFKKLQGGVKAKDIDEGYRFKIISATDNALQLQSAITYEGKPVYMNYYFTKA